jgi:hypothetical protein
VNVFKTAAFAAVSLSAVLALPDAASAADASVGFRLVAVVQPFCRVQSEVGDAALFMRDGVVELGMVREVCNTQGYRMDVQLLNVTGGLLSHGSEQAPVDPSGQLQLFSNQARVRTANWRLTNAALTDAQAPVFMRVSISPL